MLSVDQWGLLLGGLGVFLAVSIPIGQHLWRRRRDWHEIRKVSVSVIRHYSEGTTGVLTTGELVVTNGSGHLIPYVIVVSPDELMTPDFRHIVPGQTQRLPLPLPTLVKIPHTSRENPLVAQVTDWRGRAWHWEPETNVLQPTAPPLKRRVRMLHALPDPVSSIISALMWATSPSLCIWYFGRDFETGYTWEDLRAGKKHHRHLQEDPSPWRNDGEQQCCHG